MRRKRFEVRPQVEGLEAMTLLSGAPAMMAGAAAHAVETMPAAAQPIVLAGTAHGTYVSRQSNPDTGTTDSILARGRIAPLGQTLISGSFTTPGFIHNAHAQGTLVLRDARGSVTLKFVGEASPTVTSTAGHTTYDFTYTITRGTGKFRNAQGTGGLSITLAQIRSGGSAGHHFSVGRATVTLSPLATPLA